MEDRNIRAVETMCKTGMDLETLLSCFPDMNKQELIDIYKKCKSEKCVGEQNTNVSVNCS